MKKILIVLVSILAIQSVARSQTISLTGYGGYVFGDNLNFNSFTANIQGAGTWGVGIEGITAHGSALELVYQQQNPTVVVNGPFNGSSREDRSANGSLSWILLNFNRYFIQSDSHVQPYGGLGLGVLLTNSDKSSGYSYFAWDAKLGVKIKTDGKLGFKLQAQLLSSTAASGSAWYYGYVYTTYSTLWQFGLLGGITFDFGGK
jgi:hypothetical protein